jgi:glycosyltransferase involved in cell wall biosynthesis
LPQMIEHGKEGLLVRPGSALELCEAMTQVLSGEDGSRECGERAKERALTYFAPQRELDEYMQVYRDCLVAH